ncbi:hypothetical protein ACPSTS_005201, partial [Escherichia coli]
RVLDPVGTFHIFSDNAFVNPELSNITGMAQEKGPTDVICQQDVIFLKKIALFRQSLSQTDG